MKTTKSTSKPAARRRGAGSLLIPLLAAVLLLAFPGCETPGPEQDPSDYPDPGHPTSPDPAPSW